MCDCLVFTDCGQALTWFPAPRVLQVHVNEFSKAARAAGALGLRKSRLVGELLRYGVDAFSFVENEYYKYVRSSFWCHASQVQVVGQRQADVSVP